MPSDAHIRGERWSVNLYDFSKDPNFKNIDATTDCNNREIFIQTGLDDAETREALLHELFHAGACIGKTDRLQARFWNSDSLSGGDHDGFDRLGDYTSDLLRENPDLTYYLAGVAK